MRDAGCRLRDAGGGGVGSMTLRCAAESTIGRMTSFTPDVPGGYQDPLERLQAYRLGMDAVRDARIDGDEFGRDALLREVAGQLLRAAGSIPANIAEGYSRGTAAERRKFLEYALGSTRECIVWYESVAHPIRDARIARLVSIRRLLLTMIRTARENVLAERKRFQR